MKKGRGTVDTGSTVDLASVEAADAALERDEILYLPLVDIDPDPEQPRVAADTELQESIESVGVMQAITVRPHPDVADRWMIVDGERRYRGATAAGHATIPSRITYEAEDGADRLLRQLIANTGKPLTAIEEARAYQRIMAEKGWSQAQLAKARGVPRSTVGDRMALLRAAAWVPLLEAGEITSSQIVEAARFADRPAEDHEAAIARMRQVAEGRGALKLAELEVTGFRVALERAYRVDDEGEAELAAEETAIAPQAAAAVPAAPRQFFHDPEAAQLELSAAEIRGAAALAEEIENAPTEKVGRKLTGELHAAAFWARYRELGFDRFREFARKHDKAGLATDSAAARVRVAEQFDLPWLPAILWRHAPEWFQAAAHVQDTDIELYHDWKARVGGGDLLPTAWGATQEEQLAAIEQRIADAVKSVTNARVVFGEAPGTASAAVSAMLVKAREKAAATRAETERRQAEFAREQAEEEAASAARREQERTRRAQLLATVPEYTDTQLLDALDRYEWDLQRLYRGNGIELLTGGIDIDGDSIREVLRIGLAAQEAADRGEKVCEVCAIALVDEKEKARGYHQACDEADWAEENAQELDEATPDDPAQIDLEEQLAEEEPAHV